MGSEKLTECPDCAGATHGACPRCREQRAGGVTGDLTQERAVLLLDIFGSQSRAAARGARETLLAGIATLRAQLAAAERERDAARAGWEREQQEEFRQRYRAEVNAQQRDAATSRAETAERERDTARSDYEKAERMGFRWKAEHDALRARAETAEGLLRAIATAPRFSCHDEACAAVERLDAVVADARAHLQSLKGGSDAEG